MVAVDWSASDADVLVDLAVAEGVGFEPTVSLPTHAFQACRFGRSRTPPGCRAGYPGVA